MPRSKQKKTFVKGRAAGIMIEDFDAKLDLVVEGFGALQKKVESGFEEVHQQFEAVHQRLDHVDGRLDRIDGRLDRIESEIVGIRVLLGQHDAILKRHEEEIVFLKQASSPH